MRCLIIDLALVVVLVGASTGRGDFILSDNQYLEVTSFHETGVLYDFSSADVKQGGNVTNLYVNDLSSLAVSGGYVHELYAYGDSSIDMSSGFIY